MSKEYIIAGFRVRLHDTVRLFGSSDSHMARAFAPFETAPAPNAPVALELHADRPIEDPNEETYTELSAFPFEAADAKCRFGRTRHGYLLRMTSRDGKHSTRFFKAFDSAEVYSDLLVGHPTADQTRMRFGLWIMFGLAIAHEAIAIHSSTIEYRERAVLFLGESGTGKSTHTRLWQEHIPGARLLNDDSPIIRMQNGSATVFGSPWSGKTPCHRNIARPIAGIVRLSQAPYNELKKLSPLRSIGSLLPSCPPAFAYDTDLQDCICRTLSDILTQVPVYHLACLPDRAAASLCCTTIFDDEKDRS